MNFLFLSQKLIKGLTILFKNNRGILLKKFRGQPTEWKVLFIVLVIVERLCELFEDNR